MARARDFSSCPPQSIGAVGDYNRVFGGRKPLLVACVSTPERQREIRTLFRICAWWADSAAEARAKLGWGEWRPDHNGDPDWYWTVPSSKRTQLKERIDERLQRTPRG